MESFFPNLLLRTCWHLHKKSCLSPGQHRSRLWRRWNFLSASPWLFLLHALETTSCRLFALTTCSGKPCSGGGEGLSSSFIGAPSTSVPEVLEEGMKCQSASVSVGQAVEDDDLFQGSNEYQYCSVLSSIRSWVCSRNIVVESCGGG